MPFKDELDVSERRVYEYLCKLRSSLANSVIMNLFKI